MRIFFYLNESHACIVYVDMKYGYESTVFILNVCLGVSCINAMYQGCNLYVQYKQTKKNFIYGSFSFFPGGSFLLLQFVIRHKYM